MIVKRLIDEINILVERQSEKLKAHKHSSKTLVNINSNSETIYPQWDKENIEREQISVQHMLVLFQFSKTFYFPLVVNLKNITQQKNNKTHLEAKH